MESSVNSNTGNKQILSLLWLALRKAASAVANLVASSNFLAQTNAAPIGPALTVTWSSSPFTTTVGKTVRVRGEISGTTSAIDLAVGVVLLRDGLPIGPTGVALDSGHLDGKFAASIPWIDTLLAVGGPHVYSIQAFTTAANTITVPIGGAAIVVEERPAP
jgi:hypothetical protein